MDLEHLEEQFLAAKLRECTGTIFWFCARNDRERIALFRRVSQAAGRQGRDGRAECTAFRAEKSAERFDKKALFVTTAMKGWLEDYLDACPPEARHLLVYSRRNNGPSPIISDFMDLWWGERNAAQVWELGAPWWLLDVETSGLDPEKDSIITLRLARLEGLETAAEQTILVRPREPLTPQAEQLTGISNRQLKSASPLWAALLQMQAGRGCRLFLDRGFTRPFLERAFERCGTKPSRCFLALDCLLEQLRVSPGQKTQKLLDTLPDPPRSWPNVPPEDRELARLYQLTRALLYRLEQAQ